MEFSYNRTRRFEFRGFLPRPTVPTSTGDSSIDVSGRDDYRFRSASGWAWLKVVPVRQHLCYYAVRHDNAPEFELALVAANFLQTANFALNFLLYCACNSQFRDTWKHLRVYLHQRWTWVGSIHGLGWVKKNGPMSISDLHALVSPRC